MKRDWVPGRVNLSEKQEKLNEQFDYRRRYEATIESLKRCVQWQDWSESYLTNQRTSIPSTFFKFTLISTMELGLVFRYSFMIIHVLNLTGLTVLSEASRLLILNRALFASKALIFTSVHEKTAPWYTKMSRVYIAIHLPLKLLSVTKYGHTIFFHQPSLTAPCMYQWWANPFGVLPELKWWQQTSNLINNYVDVSTILLLMD